MNRRPLTRREVVESIVDAVMLAALAVASLGILGAWVGWW